MNSSHPRQQIKMQDTLYTYVFLFFRLFFTLMLSISGGFTPLTGPTTIFFFFCVFPYFLLCLSLRVIFCLKCLESRQLEMNKSNNRTHNTPDALKMGLDSLVRIFIDWGIEAGNMSTIKIHLPDKNICFSFKSTLDCYFKSPAFSSQLQ